MPALHWPHSRYARGPCQRETRHARRIQPTRETGAVRRKVCIEPVCGSSPFIDVAHDSAGRIAGPQADETSARFHIWRRNSSSELVRFVLLQHFRSPSPQSRILLSHLWRHLATRTTSWNSALCPFATTARIYRSLSSKNGLRPQLEGCRSFCPRGTRSYELPPKIST